MVTNSVHIRYDPNSHAAVLALVPWGPSWGQTIQQLRCTVTVSWRTYCSIRGHTRGCCRRVSYSCAKDMIPGPKTFTCVSENVYLCGKRGDCKWSISLASGRTVKQQQQQREDKNGGELHEKHTGEVPVDGTCPPSRPRTREGLEREVASRERCFIIMPSEAVTMKRAFISSNFSHDDKYWHH